MIHTVKSFNRSQWSRSRWFLKFHFFFHDSVDVGNLISGSSVFSKSSLYICKFLVHILLEPSLKDYEHNFASMWNEYNCAVVWTFFGIAFLWNWNENWPFPVLWPLLSFLTCWHIECSTLMASLWTHAISHGWPPKVQDTSFIIISLSLSYIHANYIFLSYVFPPFWSFSLKNNKQ